jgi:molybdate transport system substrate-binding protein
MKSVVLAIADDFKKASGHTLAVDNETVGGLMKRIEGGESFDLVIITPGAIADLSKKALVVAGNAPVARVGVGVMVKAGAPAPDVSTVDAFKRAVLAAKTVGYIDPASGGSSGIYLTKLWEQFGIADAVKAKAKLKQGGYVADLVVSGEAELGIHQISEIVTVSGVTLVGPLPAEIQNYTVYATAISAAAKQPDAAKALSAFLAGPETAAVLKSKGTERPPS